MTGSRYPFDVDGELAKLDADGYRPLRAARPHQRTDQRGQPEDPPAPHEYILAVKWPDFGHWLMIWPDPYPELAPDGEPATRVEWNRLVTGADLNGPDWIEPAADHHRRLTALPARPVPSWQGHPQGQRHARHDRQASLHRLTAVTGMRPPPVPKAACSAARYRQNPATSQRWDRGQPSHAWRCGEVGIAAIREQVASIIGKLGFMRSVSLRREKRSPATVI